MAARRGLSIQENPSGAGIELSIGKPRGEVLRTPGIARRYPRDSEYLTPGLVAVINSPFSTPYVRIAAALDLLVPTPSGPVRESRSDAPWRCRAPKRLR